MSYVIWGNAYLLKEFYIFSFILTVIKQQLQVIKLP